MAPERLGRVLPTPPAAAAPLPTVVRPAPGAAGRRGLTGPLELVQKGAQRSSLARHALAQPLPLARCASAPRGTPARHITAPSRLTRSPALHPCSRATADVNAELAGGRSPSSIYDNPQDQSLQIKQLVKENQNLKLKARAPERLRAARQRASEPTPGLSAAAWPARCADGPAAPQLYFSEEQFRRQLARLGGGTLADADAMEALMQEVRPFRASLACRPAHR